MKEGWWTMVKWGHCREQQHRSQWAIIQREGNRTVHQKQNMKGTGCIEDIFTDTNSISIMGFLTNIQEAHK